MKTKVNEQTDDLVAIARLRLQLETVTPQELMERCQNGDTEALDALCGALPAIRKRSGLSLAEFMGKDLAQELGIQVPTIC